MGANIKRRRQLRRKSKRKGRLRFKCHATKISWKKGQNVDKNLKAMGLSANPNRIGRERKKRYNKLRDMYNASRKRQNNENDGNDNNDNKNKSGSRINDETSNDFDFNPRDYEQFMHADEHKEGEDPFLLNIPDSALKEQLNLSLNQRPTHLFKPLPRYKREYYQRLINRYGKDYEAMHSDIELNFFQWTANKIQRDIEHYRYEFYFKKRKKQIVL